eukprot:gene25446-biopygen10620
MQSSPSPLQPMSKVSPPSRGDSLDLGWKGLGKDCMEMWFRISMQSSPAPSNLHPGGDWGGWHRDMVGGEVHTMLMHSSPAMSNPGLRNRPLQGAIP